MINTQLFTMRNMIFLVIVMFITIFYVQSFGDKHLENN